MADMKLCNKTTEFNKHNISIMFFTYRLEILQADRGGWERREEITNEKILTAIKA